jgi:uncharacterized protein YijF (DUF1287 family)
MDGKLTMLSSETGKHTTGIQRYKKVALLVALATITVAIAYTSVSYHGSRKFKAHFKQKLSPEIVVANARELVGTLYDPLMGKYGNIGGKLGFLVCSDVPNIAYGRAGFSFEAALRSDFKKHPEAYDSSHGNDPHNPYFHRRARNLYAYFKSTGGFIPPNGTPQVSDLVFYKRSKNGLVSHVAVVSEVMESAFRVVESSRQTVLAHEVSGESVESRGWSLVGFGRHLSSSQQYTTKANILPVPYIHQVYDSPDGFNGSWACAPTSAVMVLAYYERIRPHPITVSSSGTHESDYGIYISQPYPHDYKGQTFSTTEQTEDTYFAFRSLRPNLSRIRQSRESVGGDARESGRSGRFSWGEAYASVEDATLQRRLMRGRHVEIECGRAQGNGAWSYIWQEGNGQVFPYLKGYLRAHDLSVEFVDQPRQDLAESIVKREIKQGRPLIARTHLLLPNGETVRHYVVIVGYKEDATGFKYLVNDPFGKNLNYRYCRGSRDRQPVEYTYTDMGLGNPSRGILTIKPMSFKFGDTIEVSDVSSEVMKDASWKADTIDIKQIGSSGYIISGPRYSEDHIWWKIKWSNDLEGWSVQNWLELSDSAE